MNLQLPPDVARAKQVTDMQRNQLYTMAFQIYVSILGSSSLREDKTVGEVAIFAIQAAEAFTEVVKAKHKER